VSIDQLSFSSPTVRWNERHSFHFFVNFTAPQIAGPFGSNFWQQMVVQAAYYEPAILHALIALGSLHEGTIQSTSQNALERNPRYHFALRHVNNALRCMRTVGGKQAKQPHMRMLLTLCIMITTFEALQGRSADVLTHTIQGLKLFDQSGRPPDSSTPADTVDADKPFPVSYAALASVFAYYSSFTTIMTTHVFTLLVDARVPLPKRFCSLGESQRLLVDVRNTITMLFVLIYRHPSLDTRIACTDELQSYGTWLQQWRKALDAFIAEEQPHFTVQDTRQALILRANHLYCLCVCSLEQCHQSPLSEPERFGKIEHLLRDMVDVCEDITKIEGPPSNSTVISCKNSYFSYGLWVTESLFLASYYSVSPETRQRAAAILTRHTRPEALVHCGPYLNSDLLQRARAGALEAAVASAKLCSDSTTMLARLPRNQSSGVISRPV